VIWRFRMGFGFGFVSVSGSWLFVLGELIDSA
jgi:hypothetical protein